MTPRVQELYAINRRTLYAGVEYKLQSARHCVRPYGRVTAELNLFAA